MPLLDFDWHVHTERSYCSEPPLSLDDLRREAERKGLRGFAVTDHTAHLYFPENRAWRYEFIEDYSVFARVRDEGNPRLEKYLNDLRPLRGDGILAGIEVEAAVSGELIVDERLAREFDVVIGAVHWLPGHKDAPREEFEALFLRNTMDLLDRDIDILAHPTRIFRRGDRPIPTRLYEEIVRRAAERGVAIEINSHSQRDPDAAFARLCIRHGIRLAMSSDTHNIRELGDFAHQRAIFDEIGIGDGDLDKHIFTRHDLLNNPRHRRLGK
ncbi:MAG: PHP domain-containing protein [Planctomycetota bacterium]